MQMEPPVVPDGEVTLAGAGHRAVSLNDVERARRASVLAYCARLCDPARIAEAADAAFAELHSLLEAATSDRVVDLDRMLIEATRDAAAARVETSSSARLASRRTRTCVLMPTLLAARASGRLGASDRAGVERHLARCGDCRELERRRDEAEQAYEALLGAPVAPAVASEPFAAPGDPEPEVAATRGAAEAAWVAHAGEAGAGVAAASDAGAEPEVAANPIGPAADFERDTDPPLPQPDVRAAAPDGDSPEAPEDTDEYEADAEQPVAEADSDVFAATEPERFDVDPGPLDAQPERAAHDPRPSPLTTPRERRRRPRPALIAAMFVAGVVILAIGLLQLGGDDDSDTTPSRAERPAAPAPTPAAPAEPAASRAELRTRARLRALGDRELGPGTVGDDVKALQRLLGVQQTGNYGELTAYAVGAFQASHDLPATGIADEATKRRLARRPRPPRQAPAPPATTDPADAADPQGQQPPATGEAAPPAETQAPAAPQGTAPPAAGPPPAGQ